MTIIGYTDLAGRLPAQASQLYGTNLVNLMKLLTPEKDGQLVLDFDDVVQRVDDRGPRRRDRPGRRRRCRCRRRRRPRRRGAGRGEAGQAADVRRRAGSASRSSAPARCCSCSSRSSPAALQVHLTVFALAIVIGYYVIGNVHHALHTPLMSVTNAISGIIVVGALLQIGHDDVAITGARRSWRSCWPASTSSVASR